jgi:hypothetical protein
MSTKRKTSISPTLEVLTRVEHQLDRVATALEQIALLAARSTMDYGDPDERYVRVVASIEN